jgi:hypothetical protein
VNDVNSLQFLLNSNNNTDNKCDNTENCVALQSQLQEGYQN